MLIRIKDWVFTIIHCAQSLLTSSDACGTARASTNISICPEAWPEQRKIEVSELILATLRGFLIDLSTSDDTVGIEAGFEALARALDREEAAST